MSEPCNPHNAASMKRLIESVMTENRGYPITVFYLKSGLARQEFENLFRETLETYKEWITETGGSCQKIKGKRGEFDGFRFGGQRSWRSIRRKQGEEKA